MKAIDFKPEVFSVAFVIASKFSESAIGHLFHS